MDNFLNWSTCPIDETQTSTTTLSQSEPGSNVNGRGDSQAIFFGNDVSEDTVKLNIKISGQEDCVSSGL